MTKADNSRLALVRSGSYMMDTTIELVVKQTAEEAKGYREEIRDLMHKTVAGSDRIYLKNAKESATYNAIISRKDDGELPVASEIYYITQDEADAILAELEAVEAEKEAARQAKANQAANDKQAKYDEAAATGQPVRIRSWMEACNDPRTIDCSMDVVTEYAMPDGSTKTTRNHAN